eukprot:2427168-Amphidinium_carterae.1
MVDHGPLLRRSSNSVPDMDEEQLQKHFKHFTENAKNRDLLSREDFRQKCLQYLADDMGDEYERAFSRVDKEGSGDLRWEEL